MRKNLKSKWNSASARIHAALACCVILAVGGQPTLLGQHLESDFRLNGSRVIEAFEPIREILQQSSVVMYDGRKRVEYGTLVSSEGHFLTKASELQKIEDLSVRIGRERYTNVKVLATTADWDLALLKVDAKNLVPVVWADEEPEHGSWVVSNGSSSRFTRRARVGIISANARAVGGNAPVVLGVNLKTEEEYLTIRGVQDDSGAADAGLEADDIILSADGLEVKTIDDLKDVLSTKEPGDFVDIVVRRADDEKKFQVELRAREKIFEEEETRNDQMSGRYSKRRSNFKRVLQHDVKLSDRGTGGPLLDLNGKCVGVNIARVNRCESFAIPAAEAIKVTEKLLEEASQ